MKPIHIILILLLLTSCEMVTQIEIPEEPRKAVINSVFSPDSTWWISVTTTTPIQPNFRQAVFNEKVTLTDETGHEIPLTRDDKIPSGSYGSIVGGVTYTSISRPLPGMTYHIQVTGTNVMPATATSQLPTIVELIDVKLDSANAIAGNDEYDLVIPIEFTFDDPAGAGDYYYPILTAQVESSYTNPATGEVHVFRSVRSYQLAKNPPTAGIFDDDYQVRAMPDNAFDGKRHTANMYVLSYSYVHQEDKLDSVRFYLSHTKEDYFRYFQSIRLYDETRGNPFASPVQVYTNVEGGLGIFAGSTPSHWDFKK